MRQSTVSGNAGTICLVDLQGKAVSITSLKAGDKVLTHVTQGGRHFGMNVEEEVPFSARRSKRQKRPRLALGHTVQWSLSSFTIQDW